MTFTVDWALNINQSVSVTLMTVDYMMSVQVFGTTTLGPKPYILYVCSGLWYDHLGS